MPERHQIHKLSTGPRIWLLFAAVVFLIPATDCQDLPVRPNAANPSFEVVSVKPDGDVRHLPPDAEGRIFLNTKSFRFTPTSITGIRTLSELVEEAYSVEDWEVIGPPWITVSTYAISARMASPTTKAEARLMLRTMLSERFGLMVHRESRAVPVLALLEGKRGFKLKPSAEGEPLSQKMSRGRSAATYSATSDLDGIAVNARSFSESPVVNLTGIQGIYHVELAWTPDPNGGRYDPGFWEALERETGLKAEKRKIPRDVIVIDRAERVPTPN